MTSSTKTRLGKTVGSVKTPLSAWGYWPESGGFVVVAPSGARMVQFATESEAIAECAKRNAVERF